MLRIPATGTALSVGKHNGQLSTQADWIEASVLFAVERVSRSDVIDALMENNSYRDQNFASQWVGIVFNELERRFRLLGNACPIVREGEHIRRTCAWLDQPGYAFCMALSMLPHYRDEVKASCGADYSEQGALFEQLSAESLRAWNWDVWAVGWSRLAADSIEDKVDALAAALGEPFLEDAVCRWTEDRAKDCGLDLVVWRSFKDGWGGRPLCLVQCASGADWRDKLHTPNLGTWEKLIDFTTKPRKGLVMPFAPDADEFRLRANTDMVMLLMDRYRLLAPCEQVSLPSGRVRTAMIEWTRKRVDAFPRDNA